MHWDVIFLEVSLPKFFDNKILATRPLGGTEASIVRVAEGLGALGLKVAVVLGGCPVFRTKKGASCSYIHASQLNEETSCEHYVEVRLPRFPDLFPKAKKYLWLHNYGGFIGPKKEIERRERQLIKHKFKIIGVSEWHRRNLQNYFRRCEDFTFIYNPVPESAYVSPQGSFRYDKNVIVWTASPHKGLDKALELYKVIRAKRPSIKFMVFNPGYFKMEKGLLRANPGVSYLGEVSCTEVWKTVKKSLCVFYPGNQDEAFGCIASEANALGTPLATYARGGIKEVVSSENQLVKNGDEEALVKKVLYWHDHGRPIILGNQAFKTQEVVQRWREVLFR